MLFSVEAAPLSRYIEGGDGSKHMAEAHLKDRVHLDFSPHLNEYYTNCPSGRQPTLRVLVLLII